MVDDLSGPLLTSRDRYDAAYEKSSHKRDKKHKHKKHKSKDKRRSSLDENDTVRKKRSKGYDSEPESGEIVTAEEPRSVEENSLPPSDLRVETADIESKTHVAVKDVGTEGEQDKSEFLLVKSRKETVVDDGVGQVELPHEGVAADKPAAQIESQIPSSEDGEQLQNGSTVSGPVSFKLLKHSNAGTDEAVHTAAADGELQVPSRDDKRSGDYSESEGNEHATRRHDKKRHHEDGANGYAKSSKAYHRSRSRSVDRSHHRERLKRDESSLHREKARLRSVYEEESAERFRHGDGKHRDVDRNRREKERDRERERYGRDRDRYWRDRAEQDRDRRKRSRSKSREGHRAGARDDKRRRSIDEQEPDAPVIAPVMTEEEEQRLLEERRKRRQQILAKHQQQQAEAASVAAPTATELARGQESAQQAAPSQQAASPLPAAPQTPEQDRSSSGPSEDPDKVLDIFNHPQGEVTSGPTPPTSELPARDEQPAEEVDDMFADDGDIFSDAPTTNRAPKKPTHAAGLADAYDDAEGYYNFQIGEVMDNRYEVYESKGKGVFSTVVRARDLVRQDSMGNHPEVAIKLIRANDTMYKAAQVEQMILKELAAADPDNRKHCIRLLRSFEYRNHMCLVFEPLDMNLRELTAKYGRGVGLNVKAVGLYASQLLMALRHLKKCNVLHADIKPDNILVNKTRSKVKICDFGSAMHGGDNDLTPYLVSRFYRPPEVILGLKYEFAMDMWSVGCVLYELVTGQILFPGKTNNEMLKLMMDVKGAFPRKMLKKSKFVDKHFENDPNMSFALLEEDPVTKQPVRRLIVNPTVKKSFEQLLLPKSGESDRQMMRQLADLLEKMMVLDPEKRIDPDAALRHPFVRDFATRKKAPTVETKK